MNFPNKVPGPKNKNRCVFEGCWKRSFFWKLRGSRKKLRPRLSSEVIESPGAQRLSSSFSGFALGVLFSCTFSVLFLWISKLELCASNLKPQDHALTISFFCNWLFSKSAWYRYLTIQLLFLPPPQGCLKDTAFPTAMAAEIADHSLYGFSQTEW